MGRPLEPGLLRIFRYFVGVAMIYFAAMWGYEFISPNPSMILQVQPLMNLLINSGLFLYLSTPRLERILKQWYLPFALITYTGAAVFSHLIYLFDPGMDLSAVIARSWALVPILLVPLVLIAWQYSFLYVLIFAVFTNAVNLFILILAVTEVSLGTLPILVLPVILAFAYTTVGYIVGKLVATQRAQKRKLVMANILLGQQANTLEHLATSRERNRLARELHDTLAHTLSGVAVNLEAIKIMLAPGQDEIAAMLDHSLGATRLGLDETRRALQDLRARPLEDLGLALAIRSLVNAFSEREGIETEIEIAESLPALPPDVEQSLYRIAQEALVNIGKHADASRVTLRLLVGENRIELFIHDNGKGFEVKRTSLEADNFGLKGMRERAAVIGGTLSVESQPGGGTMVRFVWERLDDQDLDLR